VKAPTTLATELIVKLFFLASAKQQVTLAQLLVAQRNVGMNLDE
jgi:hypothetical protein